MLSFATEFPVDHRHETADFFEAIRTWILGSPHTRLDKSDLAEFPRSSDLPIHKGNESIVTLAVSSAEETTAGITYTTRDKGLVWVSTIVFSRNNVDSWVGIRVARESSRPSVRLPPAKKPVLVRLLLEHLGGSRDGILPTGNIPIRLENTDIDLAARLLAPKTDCRLPIVYASAGFKDSHIVDCDRLARNLAGMAHVVVEPNRPFSLRLRLEVDSENVYGGTVGIYWPNGGGRRSFFVGAEFDSPTAVERAVTDEIRTALMNRRPFDRCTWAYAQERASRQAIQELQASGSLEVNKYIEKFDSELVAKTQRLDHANREIARLQGELRIYEAKLASGTGALLQTGSEQDLYPNEVWCIVRDAVEDAISRVPEDSRREHVLRAVLNANPTSNDIAGEMRARLKELLRGSRSIDSKIKHGLEKMGFAISEEGKHFKLVFQGDDRYTFTLPKTGSDHRGGLNGASDIGRLLF